MAHNNSVLSQLLDLLPGHEFERLANHYGGKRRSDALSRWSQFVALTIGQLGGSCSYDANHGGSVRGPTAGIFEVQIQNQQKPSTNNTSVTTEFVYQAIPV